jgi:cytochrome b6-f complex iron-sulfur subunit
MSDFNRRRFLQVLAAGAVTTAAAGALSACSGQSGSGAPEPVGDVTAGNVSALQEGTVKAVSGSPVFVGRDSNGVYAMTTTCTHAGCDMSSAQAISTKITCSCHGSAFDLNGNVVNGPASSPLAHYAVSLATDGTITVHGAQEVSASTRTPVA